MQENDNSSGFWKERLFIKVLLFVILGISVFFRFWNLRINPKWFVDEFCYIHYAWNLMHGLRQWYNGMTTTYIPHLPLTHLINGVFLLMKYDILFVRIWAATCGVITTILLYFIGKELVNKKVGLLSAFVFSIYPLAITYNRFGFSHNQSMLFIMAAFYSCLKYKNTFNNKWVFLSAVFTGLASLTNNWGLFLVPFILGFYAFVDWKKLKIIIPLAIGPLIIFLLLECLLYKEELLFDIRVVMFWTKNRLNTNMIEFVITNYINFFKIDYFILFGGIGLLFIQTLWKKISTVALFGIFSFEILRQRANIPVFFYPATILVPMICLGMGSFLEFISSFLEKVSKKRVSNLFLSSIVVIFLPTMVSDFKKVESGLTTGMDYLSVQNYADLEETASYLNKNVAASDMVITQLHCSWLLKCRAGPLSQYLVYNGITTDSFPLLMDKKRFLFDLNYDSAKYFVLDNLTRRWEIGQNGVVDLLHKMEQEGWRLVFVKGEFSVFINPRFSDERESNNTISVIIGNPNIYNYFASVYFNRKMYDSAIIELKKIIQISPADAVPHFNLGIIYQTKGMKEEAVKEYKRTMQINPLFKEAEEKLTLLGVKTN